MTERAPGGGEEQEHARVKNALGIDEAGEENKGRSVIECDSSEARDAKDEDVLGSRLVVMILESGWT